MTGANGRNDQDQDPNNLKRPAGLAQLNDRPGCLNQMIEKVD
jgi:hypothetical protein